MLLEFRPTGLGPGSARTGLITSSLPASGEVGRICETRGGRDNPRWFWSMTVNGPMTRSTRTNGVNN